MAGNADMGKSVELGFHCPGADFRLARPESCTSGMRTCNAVFPAEAPGIFGYRIL